MKAALGVRQLLTRFSGNRLPTRAGRDIYKRKCETKLLSQSKSPYSDGTVPRHLQRYLPRHSRRSVVVNPTKWTFRCSNSWHLPESSDIRTIMALSTFARASDSTGNSPEHTFQTNMTPSSDASSPDGLSKAQC